MSAIEDQDQVLMTAIMSMDAYNRDAAPNSSGEVSEKLSSASLGSAELLGSTYDSQTLFGATAWSFDNQIFIAYRGTVASSFGAEVSNGYGVGAGSAYGPQATEALQFYQSFTVGPDEYANSGIVVTGHSLGGGLAGFVGAVYGLQGELFDNMPFELAADDDYNESDAAYLHAGDTADPIEPTFYDARLENTTYGVGIKPYANNISSLSGYHVVGELLTPLRTFQSTPSLPLLEGTASNNNLTSTDYHNMALLVAGLWAQDSGLTDWKSVSGELVGALFHEEVEKVSRAIGLVSSDDLLTEVAYSAVATVSGSQSSLPFGSSALPSLFADGDTLGSMYDAGEIKGALASISAGDDPSSPTQTMLSPLDALMEIAVQFAGDQAAALA